MVVSKKTARTTNSLNLEARTRASMESNRTNSTNREMKKKEMKTDPNMSPAELLDQMNSYIEEQKKSLRNGDNQ